jgi:hypothetical protein
MSSGTRLDHERDTSFLDSTAAALFVKDIPPDRKMSFVRAHKRRRFAVAARHATTDYSSSRIAGANNRGRFMAHGVITRVRRKTALSSE